MVLFVFTQATTMYSLRGTNHDLIQGESSNDSSLQCKYVNTAIQNTTDSISSLIIISNPVTADYEYPDENLRCTPFRFIDDTISTS